LTRNNEHATNLFSSGPKEPELRLYITAVFQVKTILQAYKINLTDINDGS
jgi:hypothetical protein